jgi:hypothetical protein
MPREAAQKVEQALHTTAGNAHLEFGIPVALSMSYVFVEENETYCATPSTLANLLAR